MSPLRIAATACVIFAGLGVACAAPAGKLAPSDIQSTFFTGMPFTS